ncbi:CDP-alcohol phosphatidyltransferase family protein [Candidatus Cardinium hertigii]|uniref:CDP-diacylglycerol--inositol 3-phosphatidyltransferase n=1 Tax=Candidatus Cardinium hertigii TaxID=247481 RepID=A0A3N2QDL3_9BACT|nr:CDP-alcohol phosphatidyltransferase family protein [Candidatus Cardinium hertigii]ROT47072.1 CDP-alcohol phosphatidyltransferase family protein [Candidatus Cardinium hertigii]ROT47752.1 CDP-alcohol phosphatidyltransferase family protein [Candidatus Cardinium hertigii]
MAKVNIFFFYPNLIGYIRIILALLSWYFMYKYPSWWAILLYILSTSMDMLDGYLARICKQTSHFGALLDQIIDRCALLGLLMLFCYLYPSWILFFQMVAMLDISSHWLYLHTAALSGAKTHKASQNPILNYYYTSKPFFFMMCFGKEAFYILLYINTFWTGPPLFGISLIKYMVCLFLPIAFVKSLISIVLLVVGGKSLTKI